MNPKKILIVDDEPDILEILRFNLENERYTIQTAKNGVQAIEMAKSFCPDLVILDVMMPGKNGMDVCKELRLNPSTKNTLIIFLTAINDDASEVKGLELGADDYLTKPIRTKVLISKVNALFRRASSNQGNASSQSERLLIDRDSYTVSYQNQTYTLPRKEFELLSLLASSPGKVFLRNDILQKIWGTDVIVGDRTIDVHIRKIRQKLNLDCIITIKGVGYKFEMQID